MSEMCIDFRQKKDMSLLHNKMQKNPYEYNLYFFIESLENILVLLFLSTSNSKAMFPHVW